MLVVQSGMAAWFPLPKNV